MEEDIKSKKWFEEIIKIKENPYYFVTEYFKVKTSQNEFENFKTRLSEKEFNEYIEIFKKYPKLLKHRCSNNFVKESIMFENNT